MKAKFCIGILLLAATLLPAQTNNLTALLQQGLFEEQASRNLDAAIASYQTLAAQFDKDRQLAATAVFRLGECYRAQGKPNEAAAQYQRILRDFSDQTTLATLSQQDLAGMGLAKADVAKAETAPPVENTDAQLYKELQDRSISELSAILPTLLPDSALQGLIVRRNEVLAERASLVVDYATNNVLVRRADATLDVLNKQIEDRIGGLMAGLKVRAGLVPGSDVRQRQKDLFTRQIALAELDLADAQKMFQVGKVTQTEVRSREREVLRLRQELAALDSSSSANSEEDQEVTRIQGLLQNSPDLINSTESSGLTLVGKAALRGQLRVVTYLLDHGAEINGGSPALFQAVRSGNRAMVELLLGRGANIDQDAENGKTALYQAVNDGFQTIAEVLLARHANVNLAETKRGYTPLHIAAQSGRTNLMQMLIAAGALVDVQTSAGRTALSLAVESGSLEAVKLLLTAGADPNAGPLNTPLLVSVFKNNSVLAATLLSAGANPNARSRFNLPGQTDADTLNHAGNLSPLWLAVHQKYSAIGQLLLKSKADPDGSQIDGRSLLFSALSDTNLLETLLAAGAKVDPTSPDETEWTPLGAAVTRNFTPAVEILLKHGANPNFHNRNGVTPLHWATYPSPDARTIGLLLAYKADPNVRTGDGKTPLDYLKSALNENPAAPGLSEEEKKRIGELFNLLRQHGALDRLPDFTRIRITRQGLEQPLEIFHAASTLTNQFTLLEAVMRFYSQKQVVIPGQSVREAWIALPFPDLGRIIIRRPGQKIGDKENEIKVSLLNHSNVVDCAQDVPVQLGDVIEIPESVHALNAGMPNPVRELEAVLPAPKNASGVSLTSGVDLVLSATPWEKKRDTYQAVAQCLPKSVQLVVAGETTTFKVYPWREGFLNEALAKTDARSVLRSSSDLSRVMVTRKTANPAKPSVFTVNASQSADQLWLQAGDVLEVPEKQ